MPNGGHSKTTDANRKVVLSSVKLPPIRSVNGKPYIVGHEPNHRWFNAALVFFTALLEFNPVKMKSGKVYKMSDLLGISGYPALVVNSKGSLISISMEVKRGCPPTYNPASGSWSHTATHRVLNAWLTTGLAAKLGLKLEFVDGLKIDINGNVTTRVQARISGFETEHEIKVPKTSACYACNGVGQMGLLGKLDKPSSVDRQITVAAAAEVFTKGQLPKQTLTVEDHEEATPPQEDVDEDDSPIEEDEGDQGQEKNAD